MNISRSNTTAPRSDTAVELSALPHNRPLDATDRTERTMGIGYGRSSGYASRDSYSGSRHYVSGRSQPLFRIS